MVFQPRGEAAGQAAVLSGSAERIAALRIQSLKAMRTIEQGATLVMRAINTNNAKQAGKGHMGYVSDVSADGRHAPLGCRGEACSVLRSALEPSDVGAGCHSFLVNPASAVLHCSYENTLRLC